jgi:hypothetical protein
VNAPTREDAERAASRGLDALASAYETGDPAIRSDRCKQASQYLAHAGRIAGALAAADAPPEQWGLAVNYGAPAHPRSFTPGPR